MEALEPELHSLKSVVLFVVCLSPAGDCETFKAWHPSLHMSRTYFSEILKYWRQLLKKILFKYQLKK